MKKILNGKNILITTGPVWVPIDKVRIITSIFGGSLGLIMSKKAIDMGANVTVLCGPGRTRIEKNKNLKVLYFKYFDDLYSLMKKEISSKKYDAVIHSAAVPDYIPEKVFNGKIKSGSSSLIIKLKPTFKIIDFVKKWDPSIYLVKFKLEVGLGEDKLIDVAKKSMRDSKADLIVANDLSKMKEKKHTAFIINSDNIKKVLTKESLASELFKTVSNNLK